MKKNLLLWSQDLESRSDKSSSQANPKEALKDPATQPSLPAGKETTDQPQVLSDLLSPSQSPSKTSELKPESQSSPTQEPSDQKDQSKQSGLSLKSKILIGIALFLLLSGGIPLLGDMTGMIGSLGSAGTIGSSIPLLAGCAVAGFAGYKFLNNKNNQKTHSQANNSSTFNQQSHDGVGNQFQTTRGGYDQPSSTNSNPLDAIKGDLANEIMGLPAVQSFLGKGRKDFQGKVEESRGDLFEQIKKEHGVTIDPGQLEKLKPLDLAVLDPRTKEVIGGIVDGISRSSPRSSSHNPSTVPPPLTRTSSAAR